MRAMLAGLAVLAAAGVAQAEQGPAQRRAAPRCTDLVVPFDVPTCTREMRIERAIALIDVVVLGPVCLGRNQAWADDLEAAIRQELYRREPGGEAPTNAELRSWNVRIRQNKLLIAQDTLRYGPSEHCPRWRGMPSALRAADAWVRNWRKADAELTACLRRGGQCGIVPID